LPLLALSRWAFRGGLLANKCRMSARRSLVEAFLLNHS
jgi:hypothetical protein